jgi:hypothetical protein
VSGSRTRISCGSTAPHLHLPGSAGQVPVLAVDHCDFNLIADSLDVACELVYVL